MKRLIVIPVLFILAFAVTCNLEDSGEDMVLFFEDFEINARGQFPWTVVGGNGIPPSQTGAMGDALRNDDIAKLLANPNWAIRFSPGGNNPRGAQLNFKSIGSGDQVTLNFDWYIANTPGTGRLAIQDSHTFSPGSAAFDSAVYSNMFIVFEVSNGNVYHYLGNIKDFEPFSEVQVQANIESGRFRHLVGIEMNKWHKVNLTIDFTENSISYSLRESISGDIVIPNRKFVLADRINYSSQMASIRFFSNTGNWEPYLDNVKLTGTPTDTSGYYDWDIPYQPGYTDDNF